MEVDDLGVQFGTPLPRWRRAGLTGPAPFVNPDRDTSSRPHIRDTVQMAFSASITR